MFDLVQTFIGPMAITHFFVPLQKCLLIRSIGALRGCVTSFNRLTYAKISLACIESCCSLYSDRGILVISLVITAQIGSGA